MLFSRGRGGGLPNKILYRKTWAKYISMSYTIFVRDIFSLQKAELSMQSLPVQSSREQPPFPLGVVTSNLEILQEFHLSFSA